MTVKNKGRNDGGILMSQKNVFYENKKEKAAKSSHLQTDLTVFYPPPLSLPLTRPSSLLHVKLQRAACPKEPLRCGCRRVLMLLVIRRHNT